MFYHEHMDKTFLIHTDPGQAWIAVRGKDLAILGIEDQISEYSKVKNKTVYLDDCDSKTFIRAYSNHYKKAPSLKHAKTLSEAHWIRKLAPYEYNGEANAHFSVYVDNTTRTDWLLVDKAILDDLGISDELSTEVRVSNQDCYLNSYDVNVFKNAYLSKYKKSPTFQHAGNFPKV